MANGNNLLMNARLGVEMAVHSGDMIKTLLALQGTRSVYFVIKKLRKSQVHEHCQPCRLVMPSWFVQKHGDKLHQIVVLRRSGVSTKPHMVHLNIFNSPCSSTPEVKLGRGWRWFSKSNKLVVGDALIFELRGISEFAVHTFRGSTENPEFAASTSTARKNCPPNIDSELSRKNGNDYYRVPGCSSQIQHMDALRSGLPASADHRLNELQVATNREIREEGGLPDISAARPTLQISSSINLHDPVSNQLETAQLLSLEKRNGSQNTHLNIPHINLPKLELPISQPDDSAQNITGGRKVNVDKELHHSAKVPLPSIVAKVPLPSFVQRLVAYNVQDAVGNTCGAFLEVPSSFVMANGVQLQAAHVHLQGIREESLVRPVTANFCLNQGAAQCKDITSELLHLSSPSCPLPLMYCLGWGDFVRENDLRTGQQLVFTLAGDSFFQVREAESAENTIEKL